MNAHHLAEVGVGDDDAFRLARRAGGVDDEGHVVVSGLVATDARGGFSASVVTEADELLEEDARLVGGITDDAAVEDDDLPERVAHLLLRLVSVVVLLLLADEEQSDVGVADDVFDLVGRSSGVHGHFHGACAIGTEGGVEVLGHIGGVDADVLLHADAVLDECLRGESDAVGKGIPGDAEPLAGAWIAMKQGDALAVAFGLMVD